MSDFIHIGVIAEALTERLFLVRLDTEELILGCISARMQRIFGEILPGDRVVVERYDSSQGRIIYRIGKYPNNSLSSN